jgi:hypothetical protein
MLLAAALLAGPSAWSQSVEQKQDSATQPKKSGESNPFPEDMSGVPIMGGGNASGEAPAADSGGSFVPAPPRAETDPARSPDDDQQPEASGSASGFSSSLQGVDDVTAPPEPEAKGRRGKRDQEKPPHVKTQKEVIAENLSVGKYYLDRKNWKAALSRFQSAMVLDPENPEVYWGMAEAQQALGDYAAAKANFQQYLVYDPEGPHGRAVRRAMDDPKIAAAPDLPAPKQQP